VPASSFSCSIQVKRHCLAWELLLKLIRSYDSERILNLAEKFRLKAWCTVFLIVDPCYAFSYFKSACVENFEEIGGGEQQNDKWYD
jgi:hypothetical protein